MKKTGKAALIALCVSAALSAAIFIIEGVSAFLFKTMPVAVEIPGGDCVEYMGIGWEILKIYPLTTFDDSVKLITKVSFVPNVFIFFAVLFAVVFVIALIAGKKAPAEAPEK